MDTLTFIAALVKALAWPAVTLALVLLLRKPIAGLIPALRKLKYKDLEVDFAEGVAKLEEEAPPDLPGIPDDERLAWLGKTKSERMQQLIHISPRSAIIEAWRGLELAAVTALQKRDPQFTDRVRSPRHLLDLLKAHGLFTDSHTDFFMQLNRLRNQAAHAEDFNINMHDARSYVHNAWQLAAYLNWQELETEQPPERDK